MKSTERQKNHGYIVNKVTSPMAVMIAVELMKTKALLLQQLGEMENRLKTMCDECGGKDA